MPTEAAEQLGVERYAEPEGETLSLHRFVSTAVLARTRPCALHVGASSDTRANANTASTAHATRRTRMRGTGLFSRYFIGDDRTRGTPLPIKGPADEPRGSIDGQRFSLSSCWTTSASHIAPSLARSNLLGGFLLQLLRSSVTATRSAEMACPGAWAPLCFPAFPAVLSLTS